MLLAQIISHARVPLYRNAYALVLNEATSAGLGILYWMLAARLYGSYEVGLGSAAISAMIFLSGLSQLNLVGALPRFIPCAGRATGRLIGYAYLSSLAAAALVSLAFGLGLNAWMPVDGFMTAGPAFMLWFVCATMLWCIFTLQDSAMVGLRQAVWVPIENTVFGVAKLVLLILFAATFQRHGIFASWTLPVVAAVVPINLLIFRRLIPRHVAATESEAAPVAARQIVRFVAGDYLGALFAETYVTLLPIVVVSRAGAEANAHFYLAWIVAYALQRVALSMAASLTVEGALAQSQLGALSRRMLTQMARLLIPAALLIVICAPIILRLFGASYAAESTTLLRLLALAAIPYAVNVLFISYARVRRWAAGIVLVQAALAALILTLSYTLLPIYGIAGVGIAWLASQIAVALVLILTRLRPLLRPATESL